MNTALLVLSKEEVAVQSYLHLTAENRDKVKLFVEQLLAREAERSAE